MEENRVVLVEVTAGIAEVIKAPDEAFIVIVDWDNVESGACPLCNLPVLDWQVTMENMHLSCHKRYMLLKTGKTVCYICTEPAVGTVLHINSGVRTALCAQCQQAWAIGHSGAVDDRWEELDG